VNNLMCPGHPWFAVVILERMSFSFRCLHVIPCTLRCLYSITIVKTELSVSCSCHLCLSDTTFGVQAFFPYYNILMIITLENLTFHILLIVACDVNIHSLTFHILIVVCNVNVHNAMYAVQV
jgi:hypothetical protein